MYIIDSSVYCALFLYEDTNHEKAKTLLHAMEEKIYVPYIVLTECLTVLTYKHSKERANEFAEFIFSDSRFVLIDADIPSEVAFWESIDKNISYVDIILSYIAMRQWLELISFDEAMMKLYSQLKNQ